MSFGVTQLPRVGKMRIKSPGMHTLLVDYPGRIGYWRVGVPPSSAMDDYSFRLGNSILKNPSTSPGLEMTYTGPIIEFEEDTYISLTGAKISNANLDGKPINNWEPIQIKKGNTLDLGNSIQYGKRSYLNIWNGIIANDYLGSKTSFPLGKLGGIYGDGQILKSGDTLQFNPKSKTGSIEPFKGA